MRLLFVCMFILAPLAVAAQNTISLTDPLQVLTFKDSGGECNPQQDVANDPPSKIAPFISGCCAAPGRRGCVNSSSGNPTYPVCFNIDPTLQSDPYGTAGTFCSFPAVAPDPAITTIGQNGADITFYVTSDLHFFRRTFLLPDQLEHVQVLKTFASTNPLWPAGTGVLTNTPVPPPSAVIVDGDITTYGSPEDLGAFRMNWERGTVPASIQYPVLVGLGNHELVSDETSGNAQRMFDYLRARMGNTNIDIDSNDMGSGNYSWDWNGVHMVQLNTWAGDKTSLYVHTSDGLGWLQNDLATHVGNTTKPVMFFQHYRFGDVNSGTISLSDDDYWPINNNALANDGTPNGTLTGEGYEKWLSIVKGYNIIGMFGGHDHCLGVSSSLLSTLPVTSATYPQVPGYGLPIDDFDDGSGGDTSGSAKNEMAGLGNPCSATKIDGQKIAQTAVGSFLVTHLNAHYLDVAAVSWNDSTTNPSTAPYFDTAEGMPGALASCRKRINSQYVPAPAGFTVVPTTSGFAVTSTTGSQPNVPVALSISSHAAVSSFNFADNCGDPGDKGNNNVFYLVNGESQMLPGVTYMVTVPSTASLPLPQMILLTPLSGFNVPSVTHHAVLNN